MIESLGGGEVYMATEYEEHRMMMLLLLLLMMIR